MSDTLALPSVDTAIKLGLNQEEFEKIKNILGRDPNFTELSIFSVMWSEHCSYKNSIKWLKTLPRDGKKLLVGAGEENAGLVDLGDGLACAFKIESHNHPSALEPYQGAATGVGGIHRDIFTMGARPIAALNSLRFGALSRKHTRKLVDGVVRGIGDYGNCLGVPTVGGECYFDESYNQNILVNAMSAGIVKIGQTASAIALGVGNPVLIVGSATGKDGIHGATFASADLTEDSADDLPAVQVGDPFQEKLLLEATLEAIKTGKLIGVQDMGAAGITCSTSEMSAKGKVGMEIHLDLVPTRQAHMEAFEILLSESQERMLMVIEKGSESLFFDIFDKWDLECAQIGTVTDTGRLEFFQNGKIVADVPAWDLVLGGGAPVYDRPTKVPEYLKKLDQFAAQHISHPNHLKPIFLGLIRSPNIASKKWIFEQYDSTVRTNSVNTLHKSDSAVIRIKSSDKALCLTTDCNSAYVYLDPYTGTQIAVAEAARNIVCSGGTPVAITNCLNFGNPYNPEVYWQFTQAIQGMGDACRFFDTPVTGGNVSFYNQTILDDQTIPIYPTPTIGMMGILDHPDQLITLDFKNASDIILMLGDAPHAFSYSEYLRIFHKIRYAPVPRFELEAEKKLHDIIHLLNQNQLLQSAHDISEGGSLTSIMESAIAADLGFQIASPEGSRSDLFFFNEDQGRAIISVKTEDLDSVLKHIEELDVSYIKLGQVTNGQITVNNENFGNINEWKIPYNQYLKEIMHQEN